MAKENVEVIDDKMNLLSEGLFVAGASKNKTGVKQYCFFDFSINYEDYDANLIDSESQSTFDETVGRANRIVDGEDLSLEDEVRLYASDKPDQVTEIIKTWLNE